LAIWRWARRQIYLFLLLVLDNKMNRTLLPRLPRFRGWRWRASNTKLGLSGLQVLLWIIGLSSLGYALTGYSVSAWHQAHQKANFGALKAVRSSARGSERGPDLRTATDNFNSTTTVGGLIGVIEITRLGISSVVDEGVDTKTLLVAVGHVPGTAFPGEPGNVALAAHRDTFFRNLGELRSGDDITLTTLRGAYRYRVESTHVVDPSDEEVLDTSPEPTLTLITCYPFHYIGPAPRRFVVVARQNQELGH
jgi:sortase A